MYTTYYNDDGTVRLRSKSYDRFLRFDTNWIIPDGEDGDDEESYMDTLFKVIKVGDYYGLKSMANQHFCRRITLDGKTSCLNAAESHITEDAKLWVAEPFLSREIYNVVYHGIEKARVYDNKTITMATSSAINRTSQNNNVKLSLTATEMQTSTWDASVSTKAEVKTTITTRVLEVAEVVTEISYEFTADYNWGETEDESEDETREIAEACAWLGLGEEPNVPPFGRSLDLSREAILTDFWEKIGFPTPSSRSWVRSASPEVEGVAGGAGSRSVSPPRQKIGDRSRASSSPNGIRISRSAQIKPWRGQTVGSGAGANADAVGVVQVPPAARSRVVAARNGDGGCSSPAGMTMPVPERGSRGSAASTWAGPQPQWAMLGRAIRTFQERKYPISHVVDLTESSFDIAFSTPTKPAVAAPSPSIASASHPAASPRRSYAAVVSCPRSPRVAPMAGVPPRSPPPVSVAAAAAAQPPRPSAPHPVQQQQYNGPPGFQGWPPGAPMPAGQQPQFRPMAQFRPPQQPYAYGQGPFQQPQSGQPQYPQQFPGQFYQYPQQAVAPSPPQYVNPQQGNVQAAQKKRKNKKNPTVQTQAQEGTSMVGQPPSTPRRPSPPPPSLGMPMTPLSPPLFSLRSPGVSSAPSGDRDVQAQEVPVVVPLPAQDTPISDDALTCMQAGIVQQQATPPAQVHVPDVAHARMHAGLEQQPAASVGFGDTATCMHVEQQQ
ncbi:hypothetical protein ACQ4PT_042411 [Festuca glaucescens]